MRRSWKIIGMAAFLATLLLVGWLMSRMNSAHQTRSSVPRGNGPQLVGLGLSCEPQNSGLVFTGLLTNNVGIPVRIVSTIMEYDDEHGLAQHWRGWDRFHRWTGLTNCDTLPADQIATLSFEAPEGAKRVRLVFQYFFDGGSLRKAISEVAGNLPLKKLSQKDIYWLEVNGFLDGVCKRTLEGEWVTVPAADGTSSTTRP